VKGLKRFEGFEEVEGFLGWSGFRFFGENGEV
jgi:hypothetical protein